MEPAAIGHAFVVIVRELRDGGFEPAEDGWSAQHIAAHVAINNDAFTAAVRDLLATGAATYDNERAVELDELAAYAAGFDNLGEQADDVARSATEMAAAYGDLQEADADIEIPAVIRHEGRIVRDGPGSLAGLIEGNATYHLAMHVDQLLGLRPSR